VAAVNVSVVIPVFQEQDNVLPLLEEFVPVAQRLPGLEVVMVDDGSTDATWSRLQEAAPRFPFLRGIRADRNRGQSAAMLLGLQEAKGDILVTLDGDRQNNPADIPRLVEATRQFDVVCGYRAHRRDTWSRRLASRLGNGIRNAVTHDGLRDTGCSLKAFRRVCAADLPPVNGVHRFMGAYFRLAGRTIEQVPVDHRPRTQGVSKYTNLKRLPRTAFDLIGFLWYRSRVLRDLRARERTGG
jgi:dolichol-phosphate mannosyltransferase